MMSRVNARNMQRRLINIVYVNKQELLHQVGDQTKAKLLLNPLNPELNPIC
jgi:hypothetical protein